jgi:hypothetical protein
VTQRRTKPRPGAKRATRAKRVTKPRARERLTPGASAQTQLRKVRELCLALPEVTEKPSHGAPTFFHKKKVFVYFLDNHHDDGRLALWCAAPDGAQAMLVDNNPDHYFVPPYVGYRGWVGVRLDRDAEWSEVSAVIESAYQWIASKRR